MYQHYRITLVISAFLLITASTLVSITAAAEGNSKKEGNYLVIEGRVSRVVARSLTVDGQQYPISMFAKVFDKNGNKLSVQLVANIGKIDKAKIYVLGGKVERIIVLENI